jgi:hypothetical protein
MEKQSINKSIIKCMYCYFYSSKLNLPSQVIWHILCFLYFWMKKSHLGKTIVYLRGWTSMKISRLPTCFWFSCVFGFFLRQNLQNLSNYLSNIPYMRGFTECEPQTLKTSAKYTIQTYFISKLYSPVIFKIRYTDIGMFPTP